jgi:predicted ATPase
MDNFEHLVEGAGLVTEILQMAAEVKVLATSRVRLNVQGEHPFAVGSMGYPEREIDEDVTEYSAVKLFLSSVRRVQPNYEPLVADLTTIAQICRQVEGIPLGILLAAAWAEMLTPAEITAEIGQSLDFLETDLRDLPERQRSLRAVFDYSWRLLTEQEREALQALSVFRGGFTRQAAQQVSGASLRELMALVNKSMLYHASAGRYEMHELLRQFATEKLETSGEAGAARDAHTAYYAEFMQQREADLTGRRQLEALDEIEVDFENVRVAWNWALKQKNYTAIGQSLGGLSWFCAYRSRDQEYTELFQKAREQLAPDPDEEPHLVWGRILGAEYFISREVDSVERALAIAQKHNNRRLTAVCLRLLGEIAFNASDHAKALSLYEESLAHFRDLDHSFFIAEGLYEIAEIYRLLGQPEEAIKFARQSLAMSREIGDKYWASQSLVNTGVIALYTGNYTEAEGHLREANTIAQKLGYRKGITESNVVLGKLAFLNGDFETAKALAEEALEIATDIGNKRIARSASDLGSTVAAALGEESNEHPDEQALVPVTDIPPTIDRFQIKELLGAGSFGSVYLAHDPDNGRDVALKVANPEALRKTSRMFDREAEVIAKLKHPAFPEFYGYGETADNVYIVTEYISGKDLEEIIEEQEGFLPQKAVIEWALQLCDAFTYMHSQRPTPIIFRDVKPANVMIDHCGRARWIDFLFAEPYQAGREQPPIGRKHYVSPEGHIGYSDARSDIYALGATLYHLLTRRDPRCQTPFSFHNAPPRSLNSAISEELEAVVLKAVEYKAIDRHQNAAEMKTALLACL